MSILCKLRSSPSLNHCCSLNSPQKHHFVQLFPSKPSTSENDADGGDDDDDDDAPTTSLPWPSPSPNARRDKISRKGKPLTLMNTLRITYSTKFTHFLYFSPLNLLSCTKPGIRKLRRRQGCLRHPLWPWHAVACLPQCVEPAKQSLLRYSFFQ